jgi:sterol desaturase/sphingolipid hydroxylase (fatty acid hydroxylase superfamily)
MKDLIIAAAAPAFVLLILAELLYGWLRGRNTYRMNDSVSSISLGVMSQVIGVFTGALGLGIYALAFKHLAITELPAQAWWTWVLALVAYDFCFYWSHRLSHEVNLLWATHVVHHSSEEYNLSTALRQPSTGFLFGWIFYWPLAVIGIPPLVMAIAGTANLLYQFWIHTRHVGTLGWFDRWFASPSNHRVHHGQNDYCLDRNYGGMFMVWDRLFGTYADERPGEEILYGIRGPLRSWNPVWGNLHFFSDLWRDFRLADGPRDRLKVWFASPAWRPAAAASKVPKPVYDPTGFEKFDPPAPRAFLWYGLAQFAVVFVLAVHFLVLHARTPLPEILGYAAVIVATLVCVGGVIENRAAFVRLELMRLVFVALGAGLVGGWFGGIALEGAARAWIIAPALVSAIWLVRIAPRSEPQPVTTA